MKVIEDLIKQADQAIKNEDFDQLMNYYSDDAILVIRPGKIARGKQEIKEAFIKIAKYFDNSLVPTQGKMEFLRAGNTVLVISQTFLAANNEAESEYDMERRATYIYQLIDNKWLCIIDNSYGTSILDKN